MTDAPPISKSRGRIWLIYALFLGSYILYWAIYVISPDFHGRNIQGEDRTVEWITFAGFAGSAATAFSLLRRRNRLDRKSAVYFFLLGLFFFVCAGEELSWGQRIIGFKTPEQIARTNEQQEFNLHNLKLKHVHPKDIFSWLTKGFGLVGPLLYYRTRRKPDHFIRRYLPPLYLVPCFLLPEIIGLTKHPLARLVAGLVSQKWGLFVTQHVSALVEEVQEMYWALSLCLALLAIRAAWRRWGKIRAAAVAAG